MKEEIINLLSENYIKDLAKKEFDEFQRAEIIEFLLKTYGCSQRALAKKLGMSHSTLQDHHRWLKINPKQFKQLTEKGLNKTEIYRQLRNNIGKDTEEIVSKSSIDFEIDTFHILVRSAINNENYSKKTALLIRELQNSLNRLLMRCEK